MLRPMVMTRDSIDTIGLVVIKHSHGLTPQGRARDAAGLPTSAVDYDVTEQAFELQEDGESRQSVIDSMRKAAANYRNGGRLGDRLAEELLHFADRVEQIHETVGELLARTGLEEGDRVELRFPTVAEDRARLARLVAQIDARKATKRPPSIITTAPECGAISPAPDGFICTTPAGHDGDHIAHGLHGREIHRWPADERPTVVRDADGRPPNFESFPGLNEGNGYDEQPLPSITECD